LTLLQVKRFSLHTKPVKHISFEDKAEYFATCCGDNYISVSMPGAMGAQLALQGSSRAHSMPQHTAAGHSTAALFETVQLLAAVQHSMVE
jgi:hypothetical protein